jgi:hypothetical protein
MTGLPGRPVRLAVVLAIGITLIAAPAASADHTWVTPAGEGCSFDVLLEATHLPEAGRNDHSPVAWGDGTLTNLDTGATYFYRVRYLTTETFDPVTDTWLVEHQGRRFINFYPGDQGPNGLVEEPGLYLAFSGSIQYTTSEAAAWLFTSFSYQGTYVDVCAELSG